MKRGRTIFWAGLAAAAVYYAYHLAPVFFEAWDTEQPLQWWAARATGFAAYVAMAVAMIFGLMVSSRGLDGAFARKTVLEHHQQWTLSALVLSMTHVIVITTDKYVSIDVAAALVPGRSSHLTGGVALGTVALWGLGALVVSSWLRTMLSYQLWRIIHAGSTGVFVLALTHGVVSGTDTPHTVARAFYVGSAAAVFAATIFRLLYEARKPRAAAPRSTGPRAMPPTPTLPEPQ